MLLWYMDWTCNNVMALFLQAGGAVLVLEEDGAALAARLGHLEGGVCSCRRAGGAAQELQRRDKVVNFA